MRRWLPVILMLVLIPFGSTASAVMAEDDNTELLVRVRTVSEGVASLCETMTGVTHNFGPVIAGLDNVTAGMPVVGGGVRLTMALLGVPDKVNIFRNLVTEQNKAVMASLGKMEGELVKVSSRLDEIGGQVEGVRRDVARISEEQLFTDLCSFQKTLGDDPPRDLEELRGYQKELRRYINSSHAMLRLRGREVPFAVALSTAGISLTQLHKLDLTMAPIVITWSM